MVERVEDAANDLEAMHVHLKDIVDPKDRLNFWWETSITMPKLRYVGPFHLVTLVFQLLFRPAAPIVSTLRHLYNATIRILCWQVPHTTMPHQLFMLIHANLEAVLEFQHTPFSPRFTMPRRKTTVAITPTS